MLWVKLLSLTTLRVIFKPNKGGFILLTKVMIEYSTIKVKLENFVSHYTMLIGTSEVPGAAGTNDHKWNPPWKEVKLMI